jgi:hypothetical protein
MGRSNFLWGNNDDGKNSQFISFDAGQIFYLHRNLRQQLDVGPAEVLI